jgi:putative ABC transport system permease protein
MPRPRLRTTLQRVGYHRQRFRGAAIFTIVNAVMLRPLPYAEPGRLVGVWGTHVRKGGQSFLSPASFLDAASLRQIFDRTEGVEYRTFTAITGAGPVRVNGARTSAGLFSMLGVAPIIGRSFVAEDDQPDGTPVVMLSDRVWRQQFNADSSWIGKPVILNGTAHIVIGVLPPTLQYPLNEPDLFVPLAMSVDEQQRRHTSNIQVFARLASGVSPMQAQSVLTQLARRSESRYPQYAQWAARVIPLDVQMIASVREGLLILLGAVALVLLIACANIGNLLLVRGTMRRREIAMRLALGASRARVVRQLLTDSVILASLGAIAGLALAYGSLRALHAIVPPAVLTRSRGDLTLDGAVVAFTCIASFVAALIFGLAPALRSSRVDLHASLEDASLRASRSPRDRRVRNALVIAEIALSVMLLIGAGLLIVSFWRLQRVDPGFRSDSLLTFRVSLPESKYPDDLVRSGATFVWSGHTVPAF